MNFESHAFVAWNPKFLERTGLSDHELRPLKLEEILRLGDSWSPVSGEDANGVEYVPCVARRLLGEGSLPGFVIRNGSRLGYVMLHDFGASAQFEQGKTLALEEERNRIAKAFHDEVSSSMLAALFLIETAKNELEEAGLPQAKVVAQASDILAETAEKIADVVTDLS